MKSIGKTKALTAIGLAAIITGATMAPQNASAGDKEWATVGKVLAGITVANVLFHTIPVRIYKHQHYNSLHPAPASRFHVPVRARVDYPIAPPVYRPAVRYRLRYACVPRRHVPPVYPWLKQHRVNRKI